MVVWTVVVWVQVRQVKKMKGEKKMETNLKEAKSAAEILTEMIQAMTPEEQSNLLFLIQGVKVGEAIGEKKSA